MLRVRIRSASAYVYEEEWEKKMNSFSLKKHLIWDMQQTYLSNCFQIYSSIQKSN